MKWKQVSLAQIKMLKVKTWLQARGEYADNKRFTDQFLKVNSNLINCENEGLFQLRVTFLQRFFKGNEAIKTLFTMNYLLPFSYARCWR